MVSRWQGFGLSHYLVRHWRGQQSFGWSFWINLVAVRLGLFVGQSLWLSAEVPTRGMQAIPVAVMLLLSGLLFVWQAVGVVRASEAHLVNYGSRASVMGAQLGIVGLLLLSLSFALETYQTTLSKPDEENFAERMEREHAATYSLEPLANGHEIRLQGLIAHGVTRRLRTILEQTPTITGIVLDSDGGNVYEGRGLARLFQERRLATRVESRCASACTIAFIGGAHRSLGRGARFGLHGYRLDTVNSIVVTDAVSEQQRDQALYQEAGVAPWFVERMFTARADEMWWPQAEQLLRAGVVHDIDK